MAMSEKEVERYLDSRASKREVLNAIEQLLAAHVERHHTTGVRRLYNRMLHQAKRMRINLVQARRG